MPPVAPVTSAVLSVEFEHELSPNFVAARQRGLDVLRRADGGGIERRHDALGEAGQHLAGADLVDVGDAVGGHARHALAPAHRAGHLLDEALLDLGGIGDRRGQHVGDERHRGRLDRRPCASASAMASAAGCISAQWKGALTLSGMKRRTPCALASCAARSMALLAPEITACVGSLSLASWHTSPCAASAASFSRHLLADAQQRRHGALPDRHGRLHGLAARSSGAARRRRR